MEPDNNHNVIDRRDTDDIRNYYVSYGRFGLELTWEGENYLEEAGREADHDLPQV